MMYPSYYMDIEQKVNEMNPEESVTNLTSITDHVSGSERLGAIGSPSTTTQLTIDIFGSAVNKKLLGELGVLQYKQEGIDHYALGQITEIILKNKMLEQAIGRGIVRQRERWDAVQERQDTHTATMNLSAVFLKTEERVEPSIFGTVPPTGTSIHFVSDSILQQLLEPCKDELFYLGQAFGSSLNLPMWFKHFGKGGQGESYNIGIFGRTGSGKSVLAQMLIVAYARHKQMSIFVLDPQGEFAKVVKKSVTTHEDIESLEMGEVLHESVLSSLERTPQVIGVDGLILDRWNIFFETLLSLRFFNEIGVKKSDYQSLMADYVEHRLRKTVTLKDLHKPDSLKLALKAIIENVGKVYGTEKPATRVVENATEAIGDPSSEFAKRINRLWNQAASLFKHRPGARKIDSIVKQTLKLNETRPLMIINLSKSLPEIPTDFWNDFIKPLLIDRFLKALMDRAEDEYEEGKSLNTLVVIDEAHRLAPREKISDDNWGSVKSRLKEAVKTTRKFGLGWLFINQELSGLDKAIINQLRTSFFGFGLGSGVELQALRELVGGEKEYLRLYQSFRDPHSSLGREFQKYSFMAIGPVSPLSFSGAPLFFDAYTDLDKFLKQNGMEI